MQLSSQALQAANSNMLEIRGYRTKLLNNDVYFSWPISRGIRRVSLYIYSYYTIKLYIYNDTLRIPLNPNPDILFYPYNPKSQAPVWDNFSRSGIRWSGVKYLNWSLGRRSWWMLCARACRYTMTSSRKLPRDWRRPYFNYDTSPNPHTTWSLLY